MDLYISTQGTAIARKKNTFLITSLEKSVILSPEKLDSIILESNSSISTGAIKLAMEYNIAILISDSFGNLLGHFCKLNYSKGARLRRKQYELFDIRGVNPAQQFIKLGARLRRKQYELFDSIKGIEMARKWLIEKIENQKKHIEILFKRRKKDLLDIRLFNEAILKLKSVKLNLENYREKIMGIEGNISKIYYKDISELLEKKWKFNVREHRNAKMPYNIILNYILGILYRIIETTIVKEGFDPALGIIHVEGEKKNSFVYDFIEKYRYLALETTFNLFNEKLIEKDFFEYQENKIPILTIPARRTISSYFKEVLKRGEKIDGKIYSIETIIKSELKKVKKELIGSDEEEIEITNEEKRENINIDDIKNQYIEVEEEEIKEVAEDELFTFI